MYLISVVVSRSQPLVWALLFKNEQNALAALGRLQSVGDIDVADEHGQRLIAKGGDLGPIMFENMAESKVATIARTLHEQRIRADVLSRIRGDRSLSSLITPAGPPVLTPMNMNGMGRG